MKKLLLLLVLFPAAAAWGQEAPPSEKPNRFGLGLVFNDRASIGARVWFSPKVGLDVALGLQGRRVLDITDSVQPPRTHTTLLDLNFDLGIPVNVLQREKVNFIVRPGFGMRTLADFFIDPADTNVRSIETGVELEFNGTAGIEYFPVRRAGFSLMAGFALVAQRPGGNSNTIIRLESLPSARGVNFSFRYYIL